MDNEHKYIPAPVDPPPIDTTDQRIANERQSATQYPTYDTQQVSSSTARPRGNAPWVRVMLAASALFTLIAIVLLILSAL